MNVVANRGRVTSLVLAGVVGVVPATYSLCNGRTQPIAFNGAKTMELLASEADSMS